MCSRYVPPIDKYGSLVDRCCHRNTYEYVPLRARYAHPVSNVWIDRQPWCTSMGWHLPIRLPEQFWPVFNATSEPTGVNEIERLFGEGPFLSSVVDLKSYVWWYPFDQSEKLRLTHEAQHTSLAEWETSLSQ